MRKRLVTNKKTQAESNSVRLAKQRNAAVRAALDDKLTLIENERSKIINKYQQRTEALEKRLDDIRYTRSMPLLLLNMVHLQRRMTSNDVSMNIANCYLLHQENHLKKLKAVAEGRGADEAPKDLNKQVLRHAKFIKNAFEEAYNLETDVSWTYGYDRSADIYEYGRTGHDLRCMSARDVPVGVKTGAYPQFKEINVSAYDARKVEGTPSQSRLASQINDRPVAQPDASPLQQLPGGKQPLQTQSAKPGLTARPPSAVRPRLTLYMRKQRERKK